MRRFALLAALFLLAPLAGCDVNSPSDIPAPEWSAAGLTGNDVQELKTYDDALYAATDSGLYRRPLDSDAGWSALGLQDKSVVDMTWRSDGALLAGVEYDDTTGTVLYKRSAGPEAEWTPFDEGYGPDSTQTIRALAAVPTSRDTLFARGAQNVARSVDGGQEWESVFQNWNAAGYQAPLLYISPHDQSLVFAGGETSIFQPDLTRSSDYGSTWSSPTGLPDDGDNAVYSMIEHPEEPGQFLLGMEGHVLRSEDGGQSWETIYEPSGYTYIFDFAARTEGSRTVIYAAGSEDGTQAGRLTLHRTDDFGDTWDRVAYTEGPDPAAIRALAVPSETNADRIYLGTTHGVYIFTP